MGRRVAIAATGPVSLGAGRAVARAGGNAVDVAVAAALAAMSTEPGITSLAGGAYVSVWSASGQPVVIDGNVEMPGRGLPVEAFGGGVAEVTTEYGGGVTLFAGHGSVATPGAVTACELAVEELGTLPWADVVAPSEAACRAGYPMGAAASRYLTFTAHSLFGLDPEALEMVTRDDGTPGRRRRRQDQRPPRRGPRARRPGGRVGPHDRRGRPRHGRRHARPRRPGHPRATSPSTPRSCGRPVRRTVGDWDLAMNPPPSVGGPMLAVMLGELATRGSFGWDDVLAIQQAVLRYRVEVHDLATDLDAAGHDLLLEVDRHGLAGLPTSASTANISVVDADGTACAVTVSSGYGAGITVPGTGILLNNALGEPELNRLGLHRLAPGTRLASNMAPTTGRTADGRVLAIGSPGADRITTALMQVLGHGCLHGADLREAIEAPRIHVRFDDDGPVVEHETDPEITEALASGRAAWRRPRPAADVLRRGGRGLPRHRRRPRGRRRPPS